MRYKIIALENKAYRMISVSIPVAVSEILGRNAVYHEISARVSVKSADDVEKGGFSTSRRSEYRHELVLAEGERNALKRLGLHVPYVVVFDYVF